MMNKIKCFLFTYSMTKCVFEVYELTAKNVTDKKFIQFLSYFFLSD